MAKKQRRKTGFALMNTERHREASSKGGTSVPPEKRTFGTIENLAKRAGQLSVLKRGGQLREDLVELD